MKNSGLTKWTQNLRKEDQNRLQGPGVHCLKIETTHEINVFFQYFAGLEITFGKNTVYLS